MDTTMNPDNITVSLTPDESTPLYAQVIIIIMYSTISILAVGGNVLVIYTVLAYQRMRTVTNYFIVNLACSDILTAVLCIPFTFTANLLMHYWPFGPVLCPVVTYAQAVVVFLSAFTLVAISLDRYRAIRFPLKQRLTSCMVIVIIVVIWVFSLSVPLPIAIVSRLIPHPDSPSRHRCQEDWPKNMDSYIYTLVLMILQYFLPLFVLLFTYTSIAIIIWVKKPPGEAENNRDQRMAASKRKMVKMMITVVVVYALCWLPLHTIQLVGDTHAHIWDYRYIQVVWISCHWLAMSSSCYNPIVYCWMNSRFRNGFRYALRWCPCIHYNPEESEQHKMKRLHTYVSTVRTSVTERTITGCNSPYSSRIHSNAVSRERSPQFGLGPQNVNGSGQYFPGEKVTHGGNVTYVEEDKFVEEKTPLTLDSD